MSKYNTGNPVGSTDPRDLYDNAENLDEAINSPENTWTDRLGNVRRSLIGNTGYQQAGVVVFQTYSLLDAYTPLPTERRGSFKVANDASSTKNGYYSWVSGTSYIKDASLVVNTIDSKNTSDAVSGKAVHDNLILIKSGNFLKGEAVLSGGNFQQNLDYERSDFIAVNRGDVITYTGVASANNTVAGYNSSKQWVQDIYTPPSPRYLTIDKEITIPSGVAYVIACSAYENSTGLQYPTSPLILFVNGGDVIIRSGILEMTNAIQVEATALKKDVIVIQGKLSGNFLKGELVLSGGNFLQNLDYERSDFIAVNRGDVITYTGVASPNNTVAGYNSSRQWVQDIYTPPSPRYLTIDKEITIPAGVDFIAACSAYITRAGFNYPNSPLILFVNGDNVINRKSIESVIERFEIFAVAFQKLQEYLITRHPSDFRTMCYNIYIGGRNSTGRSAIFEHIARALPDILSIQEPGDISNLTPSLKRLGFRYFYGSGGTDMYFASKYEILYSKTLSNVQWSRTPLYTEVLINGKQIGIVSIHLDSGCAGLCHDPDFENVVPQEPSAQRRCIQMYQIMDALNSRKLENPALSGFVVQGDYNAIDNELNVTSYDTPLGDEVLPDGLSYPLANAQFPKKQFEFYNGDITLDTSPAVDGEIITMWGQPKTPNPYPSLFGHRLDYISYSDNLILRGAEILNSEADALMPNSGLQKYGKPLASDAGYVASDHLPVVMDLTII